MKLKVKKDSSTLLKKKKKLLTEIENLTIQVEAELAELEDRSYNQWLQTDKFNIDGHKVEGHQSRLSYLHKYLSKLNEDIAKARRKERSQQARKLQRILRDIDEKREGSLLEERRKLQERIEEIKAEGRQLAQQRIEIEQKLKKTQKEHVVKNFKLKDTEGFIEQNYLENPLELRNLVERTKAENAEKLTPGVQELGHERKEVIQGFKIVLEVDSGRIVSTEPFGHSVHIIKNNEKLLQEVT